LEINSALPVELERRDRVFALGEDGVDEGEVLMVVVGDDVEVVKLVVVLLCSFCVLLRKSFGSARRFSSVVEAGEVERGDSMKDMDTVRLGTGREVMSGGQAMLLAQE
jgi:hypothetical protein